MARQHSTADFWGSPGACWHCRWFAGMHYGDSYALCDEPTSSRVRAAPETGCSSWEREPGADDEPHPQPSVGSRREEWRPIRLTP